MDPGAGNTPARAAADSRPLADAATRGHDDPATLAEASPAVSDARSRTTPRRHVAASGGEVVKGVAASAGARESALVTQSEIRVRYVETDQMGFAHHSNYFAWFEIGRTDFIRALGTSYARLESEGLLLAIGEAQVRYLLAARYDEVLVVHTWLERVQSRSVTFAYEVVRTDPGPVTRIATATMKLMALDANGTIRTLPPAFRRRLQEVAAPGVA
jgi:acyl-CoA thioester hydrolase